jgi:arylsulfatase A-like enzyme
MGAFSRRAFLAQAVSSRPPNIILVLADNLGYGDIGCYGSRLHRTPHLDKMAREGARLTHFYVASGVCTPSRAALLTGCYPRRVGLHHTEDDGFVLRPVSKYGLNPSEITIAEILKARGYTTGMIGKWHLGDHPSFLPTHQGFDSYFGIPYSEDQEGGRMFPGRTKPSPPLPLMENERVVEAPADRDTLTKRYTERAIAFLEANRKRPFFLYLPQAMPGSTAAAFSSAAFRGKSANGRYGDAIEELDWSQGQILAALRRLDLDKNTLVIWMSDNGAVQRNPVQGSNLPMGGWGYTTREGGQRVPCIVRWPGKIPAGRTIDTLLTAMDWLPTLARLTGAAPPEKIDGKDIWNVLSGKSRTSPHEAFFYYYGPQLQAVRRGNWKLVLPLEAKLVNLRSATAKGEIALYDVVVDPAETNDRASANPDVVRQLMQWADKARAELGDVGVTGAGQRPVGLALN